MSLYAAAESLWLKRHRFNLVWIWYGLFCCTAVVQQTYNKSNRWSVSL